MNQNDIEYYVQQIQQHLNQGRSNTYTQYRINTEQNTIHLHQTKDKTWAIPTPYLSDIHAILQRCHPDKKYYLTHSTPRPPNRFSISLYNHGHQPTHLTIQPPNIINKPDYIFNPAIIENINIQPNDHAAHIIQRAQQRLAFIQEHPDTDFRTDKIIHTRTISCADTPIHIAVHVGGYAQLPDIHIMISLLLHYTTIHITQFHIPLSDIARLDAIIQDHIRDLMRNIPLDVQRKSLTDSHHRQINIIRHICDYITSPPNTIHQLIQDSTKLFLQHYVYLPPATS